MAGAPKTRNLSFGRTGVYTTAVRLAINNLSATDRLRALLVLMTEPLRENSNDLADDEVPIELLGDSLTHALVVRRVCLRTQSLLDFRRPRIACFNQRK